MREPSIDLAEIDQAWFDLRDTMFNAQETARHVVRRLAGALRAYVGLDWRPGDADDVLKEFLRIATSVGQHAQQVFAAPGSHVEIDYAGVIKRYVDAERDNRGGYEAHIERCKQRIPELSVRVLWDLLVAHYPEEEIAALTLKQSAEQLRRTFVELWEQRYGKANNATIQRSGGREVLSHNLYGDDPWRLDYRRREVISKAFAALTSALTTQGENDAALAIQTAAAHFLHAASAHEWRYTSRMRVPITDDVEILLFKDKAQYLLSERLATCVKIVLAATRSDESDQ